MQNDRNSRRPAARHQQDALIHPGVSRITRENASGFRLVWTAGFGVMLVARGISSSPTSRYHLPMRRLLLLSRRVTPGWVADESTDVDPTEPLSVDPAFDRQCLRLRYSALKRAGTVLRSRPRSYACVYGGCLYCSMPAYMHG